MTSRTSACSPGSEELISPQNGLASERSARSNKTRMPCESSERDSGEHCQDGPTSAIYRQMTLGGELASTARPSSPVDSPANRSPVPGSDEARRMTVTSGRRCLESCGSSGPLGCLERMLLESSTWNSKLVVLTWKVKGIPSGRSLFQLAGSVHRTAATGASLWPTPTGSGNNNRKGLSTRSGDGLATAVRLWPTPKARDWRPAGYPADLRRQSPDLNVVARLYPTPTTPSGHCTGRLDEWCGRHNPFRGTAEGGGQLNPPWVEWLQGFPIGWTDCDASGTQSSRNRCTRSLRGSHRLKGGK